MTSLLEAAMAIAKYASATKVAQGYHQSGSNNNNYKGPGKRGYSADHKAAVKGPQAKKCAHCGKVGELQKAEIHGEKGHFKSLCPSCHAKYDGRASNINGKK